MVFCVSGERLARNIDFEVANCQLLVKTRRKTMIFVLQLLKIEGSLARNARIVVLSQVSLGASGRAVSMGEAAKLYV